MCGMGTSKRERERVRVCACVCVRPPVLEKDDVGVNIDNFLVLSLIVDVAFRVHVLQTRLRAGVSTKINVQTHLYIHIYLHTHICTHT